MKKKIAVYCRVSTHLQNNDNQKDSLIKHCEKMGWEYELFTETESSRKTRPVKQKVIGLLRDKIFDGILVWRLDRLGRSLQELVMNIDEFISKGIEFYSLNDNLDFSSATGKLNFHILASFANYERELIRERTIEGLNRVRKTKKLGRPVGAKDKSKRETDGYFRREAEKRTLANNPLLK
ncbi:MAG TPA: recombinase family protein [Cytophagaceae bacterium]|nr:recombinase family protein [Cytophagaceae bacterium]